MVVNRQKMPNKHKGRTPVEVLSQSKASHQSQSSKSTDRMSDTSQQEGKRKAPVAQNMEPFRVDDKTSKSNQRKLGIGKSHTNMSFSAKGNQIFQKIVGSQKMVGRKRDLWALQTTMKCSLSGQEWPS